MNKFVKKFQNQIFKNRIFNRGEGILVGISGGPDSVALLLLLALIKEKYQIRLKAVHVNYGLRGTESDQDEIFVRELCKSLGIELAVYRYETENKNGNLEDRLRDFRYDIFEKERSAGDYDRIAVAHTQDDQAETFLMKLLRGAGAAGLSGMRPIRGRIIRPLLVFSKKELLEFLEYSKQEYRVDSSNSEVDFRRNKIRNELLPLLQEQYNPRIAAAIAGAAELIAEQHELAESVVEGIYKKLVTQEGDCLVLRCNEFMGEDQVLRKLLFRRMARALAGWERDIYADDCFEFEKICRSGKSKRQQKKFCHFTVERIGDKIKLCKG